MKTFQEQFQNHEGLTLADIQNFLKRPGERWYVDWMSVIHEVRDGVDTPYPQAGSQVHDGDWKFKINGLYANKSVLELYGVDCSHECLFDTWDTGATTPEGGKITITKRLNLSMTKNPSLDIIERRFSPNGLTYESKMEKIQY